MHSTTNKEETDYLTNFDWKTANLYGLQKVHKSKQIITAIEQQKSSYVAVKCPDDLPFHPIVAGPVCSTSRLNHFVDEEDQHDIIAYFQRIRPSDDKDYEWFYSITHKVSKCLFSITTPIEALKNANLNIEKILEENQFAKQNAWKYERLTRREKEVLRFISEGKSNKEISNKMFISELTVKSHRQNIHKKLDTEGIKDLKRYADAFA